MEEQTDQNCVFLVDHNIEGYAVLLWGTLVSDGWLDDASIGLVYFSDVGLPFDSSDRDVWRFAQKHNMMVLTGNRSMKGPDSLEETIREENTPTSLPVVTIGRVDRLDEPVYRTRCVERMVEIALELEIIHGIGRLYIP